MITLAPQLLCVILAASAKIPPGDYRPFLKQPTGEPSPVVKIAAFALDERPVTKRQFLDFVKTHPQWRRSLVKRMFAEPEYLKDWGADLAIGPKQHADSPVTFVSWFAANAYCRAQSARLPTTDQWEYAATAGNRASAELSAHTLAWYGRPTPATLPVSVDPPNAFGVADMVGLVWEWTLDFSSLMVDDEQRVGGDASSSFFCGGGGASAVDPSDYASFMRFAFRSSLKPTFTIANLGFRCARSGS